MNEKIYKTMSRTGACSVAVGIVTLVTGIAAGVMMIISGAIRYFNMILVRGRH